MRSLLVNQEKMDEFILRIKRKWGTCPFNPEREDEARKIVQEAVSFGPLVVLKATRTKRGYLVVVGERSEKRMPGRGLWPKAKRIEKRSR